MFLFRCTAMCMYTLVGIKKKTIQYKEAFREFLVSPALISNLNVHKSAGLSHVECKILTYICEK